MSFQSALEKAWYGKQFWVWILAPLMLIFAFLTAIRRQLYRFNILSSSKPPIPVIIVGNISVGGNGKTPVVIALAEYLNSKGHKVGVLSRGYKGSVEQFPHFVSEDDSTATIGDEPFLIYNRVACNLVIDPVRRRGANALYNKGCTVIVCDDGLQHYALGRDIELVVMDSRRIGNGFLLPMGPLRETSVRLKSVAMLIKNGNFEFQSNGTQQVCMRLVPVEFVNVAKPSLTYKCQEFVDQNKVVTAICGIGNPRRFYDTISTLGLEVNREKSFPDHHHYTVSDLPENRLVMTEKDAVKCKPFAHQNCWYLKITAELPEQFYDMIDKQLVDFNNPQKREI